MFNALSSDHPYLKRLWIDVFGDNISTVDYLFENIFSPDKMFAVGHGKELAASAYYFDVSLGNKKEIFKAAYICGVATKPEERSKGYASCLIDHAVSEIKKKDYDLILLIPASLSLFGFYGKFGFEPFSYINRLDTREADGIKNISPPEFCEIIRGEKENGMLRAVYGKPAVFGKSLFYKTGKNTLSSVGVPSAAEIRAAAKNLGNEGFIISPKNNRCGKNVPLCAAIKLNSREYPENIYINFLLN